MDERGGDKGEGDTRARFMLAKFLICERGNGMRTEGTSIYVTSREEAESLLFAVPCVATPLVLDVNG